MFSEKHHEEDSQGPWNAAWTCYRPASRGMGTADVQ